MIIWVARDGMVTLKKPELADPDPVVDFADIVRDAVIDASRHTSYQTPCERNRRWRKVYEMLEKSDECIGSLEVEPVTAVLPLCEVQDEKVAKALITRFCKLGIGTHPLLHPDERWHYLPSFNGEVETLFAWAKKFEEAQSR